MTLTARTQSVTDADFKVVGNNIEIYYVLDAVSDIDIQCSTDGGKTFGPPLKQVSGDVGENVMPGKKLQCGTYMRNATCCILTLWFLR